MTAKRGKLFQRLRIATQVVALLFFFFLFFHVGAKVVSRLSWTPLFFYLDPLIPVAVLATFQKLPAIFLWSLVPVLLTFVFGRFFCGWVCPFGAIHQLFTWLGRKRRKRAGVDRKGYRIKYLMLLATLASAVFGVQLAGWLDPISLLTRSSAVYLMPTGNFLLQQSLQVGAGEKGVVAKAVKPLYDFSRRHVLTGTQRTFAGVLIVGAVLLALVLLNLYRRRFFCNYLCPLGALYGLLSRFSLLRLKTTTACTRCNACSRNCTYYGSPYQDYLQSECLLCFNCAADCSFAAIELSASIPKKESRPGVDLGRRAVIGSLASGLFMASIPGIGISRKFRTRGFIRPPGSLREKDFLKKCIRCGECMQACPTNALHPAQLQAGFEGLWTPVLVPQNGYCEYECHRCTQVCPTGAIAKMALPDKKQFKIGTAVVNRNLCYTYADGYNCAVCEEHCPVPEKAIKFHSVETWNFRGRLRRVNQIYVDPKLCIGCGICENVCPRLDQPAIIVGAEEEQREGAGE